jgi:hypothetical protein
MKVYRNLNVAAARGRVSRGLAVAPDSIDQSPVVWSIARKRVDGYATRVLCRGVRFKHATDAALGRVRGGAREVCAWITCEEVFFGARTTTRDCAKLTRVDCDPKKVDCFSVDGERIDRAEWVLLDSDGACYVLTD